MKKKILLVFGTRPEAIKMAPLVKKFKKDNGFITKVCVTAQHRHMLDQVLNIFDIKPDFDLNLMKNNQTLSDLTSRVLIGMKEVFGIYKPDIVFVHGDTTTSMATSLAAFYEKIYVAHIEAGLRTYNNYSPWPEEGNRRITGVLANYHFAPTQKSKENLLNENVSKDNIFVTGNTVIDALLFTLKKIESNKNFKSKIDLQLNKQYKVNHLKKIILVTGHRRENFGKGIINISKALRAIARKNPDVDIVYPVHLNPNVRKPVIKALSDLSNVYLIEPVAYQTFVYLMSHSYFILTDSGGIQEEAPSLGKPVLLMRETSERPEAIDSGTVKLVGSDYEKITKESEILLNDRDQYAKMSVAQSPYGDGTACEKIVSFTKSF